MKVSQDTLLNGRVAFYQPQDGYRAAIDPILLAACMNPKSGERVLDAGCGAGAASLCLSFRRDDVMVAGLELQKELAELFTHNIAANGFDGQVFAQCGDILRPPESMGPDTFHHVMCNPPYVSASHGHDPENNSRATAHVEGEADLKAWVDFAISRVQTKGSITFIQRADRLDDLIAALHGSGEQKKAGEVTILPLWPHAGEPAKRVIVRARKGIGSGAKLLPGLVLHEQDGSYTPTMQAILDGNQFEMA